MAALTKAVEVVHEYARTVRYKAAVADDYFAGAVVSLTDDKVTPVAASGKEACGIVVKTKLAAAVDDIIEVQVGGRVRIDGPTFAATDTWTICYLDVSAGSDNPADLLPNSGAAAGDMPLGLIDRFVSTTSAWINLDIKTAPAARS
jgi:hypothetical protein